MDMTNYLTLFYLVRPVMSEGNSEYAAALVQQLN